MRQIRKFLFLLLLILALCLFVHGQEGEYIFKLRPDCILPPELSLEGVEVVYEPEGIYVSRDSYLLAQLRNADLLEYFEPNDTITLMEDTSDQPTFSWPRAMVGHTYAAQRNITGKGVRVAVIDSGLSDPLGEFTAATIEEGTNFLVAEDNSKRHNTFDSYGHGTNVCRMIASTEVGLAPEVTIIPLKCFDSQNGDVEDVVAAIYTAVDIYACQVLNMSVGIMANNTALANAVSHALDKGVIVIAAAGNKNSFDANREVSFYRYPAAQEGVIAVGAATKSRGLQSSSVTNDSICVVAPGDQIPYISSISGAQSTYSGTSFAAPFVTAAAALALSQDPDLTGEEFEQLLTATAEDLGPVGYDIGYGHGLLNVGLLLAAQTDDRTFSFDPQQYYASGQFDASANTRRICIATYEPSGRFRAASIIDATGIGSLGNFPLQDPTVTYKLISLPE